MRRARLALCLLLVLPAPAAVAGATTGRPSAVGAGATELVWGPVMTLDDTSRGGHDVAVNHQGDAVVVWTRHSRRAASVYAAYRTAGDEWGPRVRIGFGTDPQVALDARGNATVIWVAHPIGWGDAIHAARRPRRTATWTDPVLLSPPAREPGYQHLHDDDFPLYDRVGASRPMLSVNADGDALVAWHWRADGEEPRPGSAVDFDVQAIHRPSGGRWRRVMAVSNPNAPRKVKAVLQGAGMDRRGKITVLWVRYDDREPASLAVLVRRRTEQRGWGPTTVLARGEEGDWTEDRNYVRLAVSPRGHAVATFGRFSVRPAGGRWSRPRPIRLDGAVETHEYSSVVMDRAGTAYVSTIPPGVAWRPLGRRWRWDAVEDMDPEVGEVALEGNPAGDLLVYPLLEAVDPPAAYRSRDGVWTETTVVATGSTWGNLTSAIYPRGGAIVVWATRDRRIQVRELLPSG